MAARNEANPVNAQRPIGALVEGRDGGADGDLSVAEDVGAEAAAVDQACGGEALQVRAWFAGSLSEAPEVADSEASSDQGVEVDSAGDDVAPCVAVGDSVAVREQSRATVPQAPAGPTHQGPLTSAAR